MKTNRIQAGDQVFWLNNDRRLYATVIAVSPDERWVTIMFNPSGLVKCVSSFDVKLRSTAEQDPQEGLVSKELQGVISLCGGTLIDAKETLDAASCWFDLRPDGAFIELMKELSEFILFRQHEGHFTQEFKWQMAEELFEFWISTKEEQGE